MKPAIRSEPGTQTMQTLIRTSFGLQTSLLLSVLLSACGPGASSEMGGVGSSQAVGPVRHVRLTARSSGTTALLQALSPVNDSVVWVSGHLGTWGVSTDRGVSWRTEQMPGAEALQFRDVVGFDDQTAVLMSAGAGALSRLFRTEDGGLNWVETFRMDHPEGFLDCMAFVDRDLGFVYGDAVDGGLFLLRSVDGGRSWTRIPPDSMPSALEGEGGFAASGACIDGVGDRLVVASGNGPTPRLLELDLTELTWTARSLPLTAGASAGATAVSLHDDGWGFVVGGAIGDPREGSRVAFTKDGGATWATGPEPVMGGALYGGARIPGFDPAALVVVGPGGLAWSGDGGGSWSVADTVSTWAVEFSPSGEGWAVGPGGRIVAISAKSTAPESPSLLAGDLVITGGRVFDGIGDVSVPNPGILVRGGRIQRMGFSVAGAEMAAEASTEVTLLRLPGDATLMPGFFDLHAHYAIDLFGEGRVDETLLNPLVFLANGVTSTFPAGEMDPLAFDRLDAALRSGEVRGPRLHRSGAYFGSARPGWGHEAMTPDSIRAEVGYWAGRGVVGFKAKGIRPDQLQALIEEAHRHGLPVTAHLDSGFRNSVNPRAAIEMGIDRVEHFLGGDALPPHQSAYASLEALDMGDPLTARQVHDQIRRFVENGVYFDATLTAYDYFAGRDPEVYDYFQDEMALLTPYARSVVESRLPRRSMDQFGRIYRVKHETVRAFVEDGGGELLTVGTDHPSWGEFFSGFSIHREMQALSRAGIPNAVVLRAATANAAAALDLPDLGTIKVGKLADLVVVRGDPLDDITATRDVIWVVKEGVPWDPRDLLGNAWGRLGPEGPKDSDWWKGNLRLGR